MENTKKDLVSVCGLFCKACTVYMATQENYEPVLHFLADKIGIPYEEIRCNGCRTETKTAYCKQCYMYKCATEKKIDFCYECNEFPCTEIKDFQTQMPHRVELFESLNRIKEIGHDKWYDEMSQYFSCPQCSAPNGWYDVKCRECSNIPGSQFAEKYQDILKR